MNLWLPQCVPDTRLFWLLSCCQTSAQHHPNKGQPRESASRTSSKARMAASALSSVRSCVALPAFFCLPFRRNGDVLAASCRAAQQLALRSEPSILMTMNSSSRGICKDRMAAMACRNGRISFVRELQLSCTSTGDDSAHRAGTSTPCPLLFGQHVVDLLQGRLHSPPRLRTLAWQCLSLSHRARLKHCCRAWHSCRRSRMTVMWQEDWCH